MAGVLVQVQRELQKLNRAAGPRITSYNVCYTKLLRILFFDEADALFGKRTDVKDAHDRFANIEISYLLERMERFKGLAILATNRRKDLDEAFLRRLRTIIEFPLPGPAERETIWRNVIPARNNFV